MMPARRQADLPPDSPLDPPHDPLPDSSPDAQFMEQALREARAAEADGDVPIGCVVVRQTAASAPVVIATGHNRREADHDPTAHAEVLALREAARQLGTWRLNDCTLYVTLEPCPMCAGAMVNARLGRLVYGCADPKAGAVRTLYQLCDDQRLNHRIAITTGVRQEECAAILREFFHRRRDAGNK
jgi:tRNA(adenine34) deaminase